MLVYCSLIYKMIFCYLREREPVGVIISQQCEVFYLRLKLLLRYFVNKCPIIWTQDAEDPQFRTTAGLDRFLFLEENNEEGVACIKNTRGAEFYLTPDPNDIIIEKTKISAYTNSNLAEIIHDLNLKTLFISGMKTQRCIAVTLHHLYENEPDLHVVTLEDCVASDDIAQHQTAISEFKKFFPPVMTSHEVITAWSKF